MNWLKKIAQNDLRKEFPQWGTPSCPQCGQLISNPEKFSNCPKCGRTTSDLEKNQYKCPECGERITTGRIGDCFNCGYNWIQKTVDLESNMEEIFYGIRNLAANDFLEAARKLGAKTVEDLTKLSYDKLLNTARENFRESYPNNPYWHDRWNNLFFPLLYISGEEMVLPEQFKKWLAYIRYEYENDSERIAQEKKNKEEVEQMEEEEKREEEEKKEKAKLFAQKLLDAKLEGWEDATFNEAYKSALDYLNELPSKRSLWRKEVRDIAKSLFSREFKVKHYYMEPKEAEEFIKKSNDLVNQSGGFEFLSTEDIVDIINKTIGITDSKDFWFGRNWGNVHPGYTATWVLNPANMLKYNAGKELKERIKAWKDDQSVLQSVYYLLDEDNRSLFFKVKNEKD